ncbi:histidine phosphatase superfamily [Entophlyctis helioformis]|nr:histidine phosphatase superfamily [Entophlyctis helioformis]
MRWLAVLVACLAAAFARPAPATPPPPPTPTPTQQQPFAYAEHLGSKAPYPADAVAGGLPAVPSSCTLAQLHLVARHGTRFPTGSRIKTMKRFVAMLRARGDQVSHPTFKNLSVPYDDALGGELAQQGLADMARMAVRAKRAYGPSGLLSDPALVLVQATNVTRARLSAMAFTGELFNLSKVDLLVDESKDADLRPHRSCSAFGKHSNLQGGIWRKARFAKIAARLSSLIGLTSPPSLKVKDVTTLFDICAAATTLDGDTAICREFVNDEFEMFEIGEDLDKYDEFGPRTPYSSAMMCSLLTGVTQQMRQVGAMESAADQETPRAKAFLRFGHAETLLPLVTALDLFDEPFGLNATDSDTKLAKRKYIASKIVPFAANIWLEVYSCGLNSPTDPGPPAGISSHAQTTTMLRAVVNGKVAKMPGCSDQLPADGHAQHKKAHLCSLDRFEAMLHKDIGCNFDKVCNNTDTTLGSWNDFGRSLHAHRVAAKPPLLVLENEPQMVDVLQ